MNISPSCGRSQARPQATDLEAQIEKLAARHSRRLVCLLGLPAHEQEDLQQDIHLALWLCCGRLETSRSAPSTFLHHVAKNVVRTIITRRRAACRDHTSVGLDDLTSQRAACHNKNPFRLENRLLMRLDIRLRVELLPTELRRTAIALQTFSPTEAARRLSVCRDTVYRHIKEIRIRFGDLGLNGYLD